MSLIGQAGAIAVRASGGRLEFLLVRAKKSPGLWIFPKGHVVEQESLEEAAIRELREEAGVVGVVVAPVGDLEYRSGAEQVRVTYHLVQATGTARPAEVREVRWCPYHEAFALLSFDDAKRLLTRARTLAEKAIPRADSAGAESGAAPGE